MRKNGLLKFIQQQMKRTDCTYIGSSAGAMIAGTDIYLAEDFDENIVGLTDLKALGLFDGSVIPHYSRRDLKRYIKNSNQCSVFYQFVNIVTYTNSHCHSPYF